MPLALKKPQKCLAYVVARHFFSVPFGHVSPSFAGFNPQIIADAANPRNETRGARGTILFETAAPLLGGRRISQRMPCSQETGCRMRTGAVMNAFSVVRDFKIEIPVDREQP